MEKLDKNFLIRQLTIDKENMNIISPIKKDKRWEILMILGLSIFLNFETMGCKPNSQEKTKQDDSTILEEEELTDAKFGFIQNLKLIALKSGVSVSEIDAFINHVGEMTNLSKPKIDLNKSNLSFGNQYLHTLVYPRVVLRENEKMNLEFWLNGNLLSTANYRGNFFSTNFILTEDDFKKIKLKYVFTIFLPNNKELIIAGDFNNNINMLTDFGLK